MRASTFVLTAGLFLSSEVFLPAQVAKAGKEQLEPKSQDKKNGSKESARIELQENQLERITVLRRREKKPDPLKILVKGSPPRECIFPRLPEYQVALANVDADKKTVPFTEGGDYRSGRQARWRFDVRDHTGRLMPAKQPRGAVYGGGIYFEGALKSGDTWDTILRMDRFIDLDPGDYTFRILYSDSTTIADMESTDKLVVMQSDPLSLHVQPRVIDVTKKEKEQVKRWLRDLTGGGSLRILAGSYGKHAHDFIKPDSLPGRLLEAGWKAVPGLLEELADEKLSARKRAWVLTLLFSITGRNDPRWEKDVVGSFSYRESGWQIWGGLDGKMTSGGLGSGREGWAWFGKIDVAKQREFAKCWQTFRDFIVVRER